MEAKENSEQVILFCFYFIDGGDFQDFMFSWWNFTGCFIKKCFYFFHACLEIYWNLVVTKSATLATIKEFFAAIWDVRNGNDLFILFISPLLSRWQIVPKLPPFKLSHFFFHLYSITLRFPKIAYYYLR